MSRFWHEKGFHFTVCHPQTGIHPSTLFFSPDDFFWEIFSSDPLKKLETGRKQKKMTMVTYIFRFDTKTLITWAENLINFIRPKIQLTWVSLRSFDARMCKWQGNIPNLSLSQNVDVAFSTWRNVLMSFSLKRFLRNYRKTRTCCNSHLITLWILKLLLLSQFTYHNMAEFTRYKLIKMQIKH